MTTFLYAFDYASLELRQLHRPAHLRYLSRRADQGKVVLAGPLPADNGGLILFEGTRAEVEECIAEDPYTVAGVARNATLREWDIVIGDPPATGDAAHTGNATTVRNYYSTVDSGSPEQVVALFAPEAVYRRPGYDEFRGRQDLLLFYREHRIIRHGVHTVENLVEDGDAVVVEGSFAGVLVSGEDVTLRFADAFRLTDQLIVERNTYFAAPLV
ncbi:MAG: SnoaL-like polyketide cyclase [Nocardioides sp.]|jgi:steroid delta-isomerase|nr:SnoaL-like polyketide cyclase [Nocardioides sp.]